jgi:hypothetical protein
MLQKIIDPKSKVNSSELETSLTGCKNFLRNAFAKDNYMVKKLSMLPNHGDHLLIMKYDSKILKPKSLQFIDQTLIPGKNLKLIFRASSDELKAKIFHEKCDNLKDTLVIIQSHLGKIFGGRNFETWDKSADNKDSGYKSDS